MKTKKSRQQRTCSLCGTDILKGDQYVMRLTQITGKATQDERDFARSNGWGLIETIRVARPICSRCAIKQ